MNKEERKYLQDLVEGVRAGTLTIEDAVTILRSRIPRESWYYFTSLLRRECARKPRRSPFAEKPAGSGIHSSLRHDPDVIRGAKANENFLTSRIPEGDE